MRIYNIAAISLFLLLVLTPQQAVCQEETPMMGGGNSCVPIKDSTSVVDSFALYYWRDRIDLDENYLDNAQAKWRISGIISPTRHTSTV